MGPNPRLTETFFDKSVQLLLSLGLAILIVVDSRNLKQTFLSIAITTMEKVTSDISGLRVEDESTADRKLLIAIDFGTTFSGVAWAQTRRVCHLVQAMKIHMCYY